MSIDTPPSPVDALLAAAKGKGDKEIQALVARMVIDSLGRPWNPLLHPRDSHGRFIETFAEIRGLFKTSGGGRGAPKISGRVVAFDHNGDVWVRVDHVADGYTGHKPGDLVPIKPDDIEAQDKLATIPKPLDAGQRSQVEALAARMEGRNPDAAAALRRAADPGNTEPIAQLADLDAARDALDADGSPEAVEVRDLVWDLSDQLGDHPSNDEVLKAAQAMVRDHLAKNPTQNAEAIARLDRDIHAEAPPAQPSAPDAAQRLAGQLHGVADRLQDVNPADAVHVRNVAAKLGDVGVTGETPEKRDARLEAAATQALKINDANLKKKIIADIKHMRENPPQKDEKAADLPENAPKARLEPPSAAEPLPPEQPQGPDVPEVPVPEIPPTPETPSAPEEPAAPPAPEAQVPSAPQPVDTPTTSAPDEPDEVDLAAPETVEAITPAVPDVVQLAPLGDLGLGINWEDMPHGLVLRGNVFPHKDDAKALGFRFLEVPGEKKRDGAPFKAWTAVGTPQQRQEKLAQLADRLGLPAPAAADGGDGGDEYPPTPQQQAVIDAVYTGGDVVVRALAGTGKTSTLKMLARRLLKSDPAKRIVYVAFNKSIQEEAQKTMPPNVEARTGDSIAFATMSPEMKAKYSDRNTLRRNADIAAFLGITRPMDTGVPGEPPMSPEEQAMRVMRAIEKFSISADDEISPQHFQGLDRDTATNLLPYAQKAWNDINSDTGKIRTTNSHITKMWALTRPDFRSSTSGLKRKADIVFFDEAQDINPVMAKVIADQKIQKVYVGDGNQAIYGFRGAEDQLDKVKADHDLPLTKSWRFGPQIAGMGNRFLALLGSKHRIEGAGPEGRILDPYTMTDPDAILVRSNAGAIGEILEAQHAGKLVGVPKGTKSDLQRLVDTADWLQNGGRPPAQLHDDLAAFRTWDEVVKAAESGDDPKVAMLARIVEDNGIPALRDLVSRLIDSGDKNDRRTPDLVVTTAHKAKGLEWDKVKIGGDFRGPRLDKNTGELIMPSPEEMRLAYVAVTRAMKELDPGSLEWVYGYTDDNGNEVKPETPSEPDVPDTPSTPEHWTSRPPTTPPQTPETGPDTTPPPAPEARVPSGPQHPGPTLLGQIIQAARDGGFTFDPRSKNFKTEGFAVARQGYGEHFSVDDPDVEAKIDAYIDQHWDTFSADEGAYLGGWVNEGEIWLDVPDVLDSREDAIAEGTKRFEIAIADLAAYANGDDGEIRLQYAERPPRGTPAHNDWTDLEGVRHVEPESAADSAPSGAGRDEGPVQAPGEAGPGPDAAGDVGAVPDGWVENTDPFNGEPDGSWTKGDYTVFADVVGNPDGLRVVEFGDGYDVRWKVDVANWSEAEARIAEHEAVKAHGGLPQDDRTKLARIADHFGLGPDVGNAIEYGNPDQIRAALDQDEKYNAMKAAYQDAVGADSWNQKQKQAVNDWFALNNDVLLKLKKADLLAGTAQPAQDAQEAPDTRTPEAPPAPEVPAYSGEQRPVQPRDLGEILNAVDNAVAWLGGENYEDPIFPNDRFLDKETRVVRQMQDDWNGAGEAVRDGDYPRAQQHLDAIKQALADPEMSQRFHDDIQAFVDQVQGALDKVHQRDKGQFEIPGVAPESAAPYVEQGSPEQNAAFDDVLQHDPDAASNIKDLAFALADLQSSVDDNENYYDTARRGDRIRAAREALNNHDYAAALDQIDGILNEPPSSGPSDPYGSEQPARYSAFGAYDDVWRAAGRVRRNWEDMLAANPQLAPKEPTPASEEPLQSWEKALLEGFEKPSVMTPDMVDAANERAKKQMLWRNIVVEMDNELGGTDMGALYNDVIQDGNATDPAAIEAAVRRLRDRYVSEGDQPAADIIDRILAANQPGPESNVPGPYDPAANPEAVMPGAPGDGSPIKDENRVIDQRVRGEIEDVKRGVGLPELPDRLDYDRNGVAVFALDLVDVPAAGKQGKGDRRRPPGIGQVRRIYVKNGVTYAEVAFYDPAFVDYPNRNRVKAAAGIKNGSPFYVWDGIRLDKVQKVDGANPDAVEYLGHLGPEEARQYAGRNAGRLAQNRGRVRPELERMANLQYIGDRYVPDANGLPVGKGDVVLYNGKKYEVARVNNDNPGVGNNVRLDLVPLGANGEPELQAGGKHAEPYARMVQFYDQPLGDRDPGVTIDELKDLVRRLDADKKYAPGSAVHDALERGDLGEITRAFNEDPAIQTYIADGRAYINDYIQRLLNANLRGNFDAINQHEQEMVRKDKNDLLNAMAAVDGRFLEGTGADRHIRREIPDAGPDREYKGNQPEVLMPLRYAQVKEAVAKARAAHPEDDGLWATVQDAIARAGALNLDDEDNYWAAMREFAGLQRAAAARAGLNNPEVADALNGLMDAMGEWQQDQGKRKAIRQGGPGGEAQLPGGRTVAPGLVRPPMPDKPAPAGQSPDDRIYADRLGMDADARARYMWVRDILDKAARAAADMPELQQYLDETNRALMSGNYGEAYHAIENVLGVPVDHPNAEQLTKLQARFSQIPEYFDLIKVMRDIQGRDWPNDFFPDTAEINAGKAPAAPAAPNVPSPPKGFNVNQAEDFQVGDVWVIENADDLGAAHPGIGEWKIKEIVPGNTANRYVLERVDGKGVFGDEAEAYLRHGMQVKRRPGGIPQAPAPAAPAAPAAPQKPAVDMPDRMRAMLKGKGDRFIRPEAKDAADALNAGMAPNGPDLQALHEDVQKRIDHYEALGGRPGKVAEYQEVKAWLDAYAPIGGGAPAAPAAPAAPREPAEIRQGIADAVDAVYEDLRADRKNNAARRQALDLQDAGDAIDAALDQAIAYHGGDGGDDIDTRNTEMSRARAAIESDVRPIDPGLADKLDDMLAELEKRFDRDDNERLANRYLDEAQKFHDRDKPDNDQRDRMIRAAQDQIDRIRRVDPTAADELDARLKAMTDTFAAEDVERARAKPVGRTVAIDALDADVAAERKRLRDEGKKAEARKLADDAEAVAEALNDAEDAHKAGDVAARDAAIEKARAAAETLDAEYPDLAEAARRAVEGNAARFARADARGAGGTTDDEIDTTPQGDRVKQAASDLHDLAEKYGVKGWVQGQRGGYRLDALYDALRNAQRAGEIKHVTTVGGAGFNGAPLVVTFNDGVRMVVKNDATGHGARAEQVLGRLYRGLGFKQPLVTAMSQDPNDDLRHFIVMEHLDDLGGSHYEGAGDPYDFDAEGKREAFDIQLANAIMASTDRHPGNIMHGPDENGRERLWLYDNGIALFNGAFGQPFGAHVAENHHDRDYANQQGDYGYVDPEVTPAQFVLSGRARGGVYVGHNYHSAGKISVDWMDSKTDDEIRSEIEDFVDRMQARAEAMAFLTPEEIQFITIRGGWVKDNWREMVDAMYELRNKTRKWKN